MDGIKKKVILDCDPGHDDAFAMMLAVRNLDVLGITTIGGNSPLESVTVNALKILEVLERPDIGVYPGHSCPTTVPLITAPQFHGKSGLDGPVLPDRKQNRKTNTPLILLLILSWRRMT